jgi:hypothetical protein
MPKKINKGKGALVGAVLMTLLLGGCAQLGPQVLVSGRPQYNIAVQQTEAQQLLLNIVRQRYNDPILFLDVTSISSGFSREASSSLLGAFGSGSDSGVGTLGGRVAENPYIFYTPNTGEKFVRQMLSPTDLRTVALLLQAGWSIERVLLLLGESANRLFNRSIDGAGGDRHSSFLEVAGALRDLQRKGQLIVGLEPGEQEGEPALTLIVTEDAVSSASYLTVCEAIQVACDGEPLRLRRAFGSPADGKTLALATRSLFSAIYHLSRHVDAPEADVQAGIASPAPDISNDSSASSTALRRLFHVRSSVDEPDGASVKVFYRNAWFYIADNDLDSKTTFALLSMLITLQSGDVSRAMPVVTLPAG